MNTTKRKVMILAHQIRRHKEATMSEALKTAWFLVQTNPLKIVEFMKMDNTHAKRVVIDRNPWRYANEKYAQFRQRYAKPGQVFFADAARFHAGKAAIISTYKDRLL